MKTIQLFAAAFLFVCSILHAQQPFEKYGYKVEVFTLSGGKYEEFFDQDTIVRIGSALFNTQSNKIVGFVKEERDTLYSEATLQPHVVTRWISPDVANQFHSPYVGMGNNPVIMVDPDGAFSFDGFLIEAKTGKVSWFSNLGESETDFYFKGDWVDLNGKPAFKGDLFKVVDRPQGGYNMNVFRLNQTTSYTMSAFNIPGSNISGYIMEPSGPTPNGHLVSNTRLPEGTYNVSPFSSTKFGDTYRLSNNVANINYSSPYLIHKGSVPKNTRGCLIPGCRISGGVMISSELKLGEIINFIDQKGSKNFKIGIYDSF